MASKTKTRTKNINKILAQEIYKPKFKHYETRRAISFYPNNVWSIDLADNKALMEHNDNYRYMLNVVDVFSRYAWSVALKEKTGRVIVKAFEHIVSMNDGIYPQSLWSDQGGEFLNKDMTTWCNHHNIELYQTFGVSKSAIVERFNRTIKTKMWRYFTEARTYNWINVLQKLIKDYNNTKHRSINMTPAHAHELRGSDINDLFEHQYKEQAANKNKAKFQVGDVVRISRMKDIFEKGYHPNWSMELFIVTKALDTIPWTYHIKDLLDNDIKGSFYEQELQKSDQSIKDDEFLVESVLDTRTITRNRKKIKQGLVKWLGYSNAHNQWVDLSEIK